MDILRSVLLATHLVGMALIVGTFLIQMRKKSDFAVRPVLFGGITQVITGLALVGIAEASDTDLNNAKIAVKTGIAVVVLVAAIVAVLAERKNARVKPWFHAAGGLAVVNLLVAVFWN